ncbi:hypothetical protein J7T55_005245 [Diaporthe amygdali]|uniref:uncharacterized protein n=1 Tax=Phomopsis amygdali TaxID=1214568 RepID=UPI0022FF1F4D|nr:uncharacterized protein J7T55_005245 [Diaporthe amygdali]KAJ0100739.1 hypothetical protein J7T55_005245 [Diaporthe amygdali]
MADASSYFPEAYDSLPSLAQAEANYFTGSVGEQMKKIRKLFIEEQVHEVFGVLLLHRHFPIEPTHRLVEISPLLKPLFFYQDKGKGKLANEDSLIPRSYRVFGEKFVAIDFTLKLDSSTKATTSMKATSFTDANAAFFVKAAKLFAELEVEKTLGLRILEYTSEYWEFGCTIGDKLAHMVPYAKFQGDANVVETVWRFNDDVNKGIECVEYGSGKKSQELAPKEDLKRVVLESHRLYHN